MRHGPWREYFDVAEQQIANRGRYRHGLPVGRWRYYTPAGMLERQERFLKRPAGQVVIAYYHPGGQLAKQGQARYQITAQSVRFFWFGEWKCYAPSGHALPSEYYRNGRKTTALVITPAGDSIAWPATQ
ncbi:toxin-antitoxin system YwqK family antitoxin [Hymenobacter rigui]|uniref:toxin-antitoxin system YwqK family antitoxin n=1 Tax=Hymenobacter rigui TaxID=334424 RepID=UPI0011CFFA11|nr:hypothetical protein [Hymenobacter rigui]